MLHKIVTLKKIVRTYMVEKTTHCLHYSHDLLVKDKRIVVTVQNLLSSAFYFKLPATIELLLVGQLVKQFQQNLSILAEI